MRILLPSIMITAWSTDINLPKFVSSIFHAANYSVHFLTFPFLHMYISTSFHLLLPFSSSSSFFFQAVVSVASESRAKQYAQSAVSQSWHT